MLMEYFLDQWVLKACGQTLRKNTHPLVLDLYKKDLSNNQLSIMPVDKNGVQLQISPDQNQEAADSQQPFMVKWDQYRHNLEDFFSIRLTDEPRAGGATGAL